MATTENWEMRNPPVPCCWDVSGWGWECSYSWSSWPRILYRWMGRERDGGQWGEPGLCLHWCAGWLAVQSLFSSSIWWGGKCAGIWLKLNGKNTRREQRPFRGASKTANQYPSCSKSRMSREFRVKLMGGPGKKSLNCCCHDK